MTIDAHHHLWRYTPEEFDWLTGPLTPLRRNFFLPDLHAALDSAGIDGAVAVQARQSLEETLWLLDLASQTDRIKGVVGWAPIASPTFAADLESLLDFPGLKGLRHVIQAEPDPNFIASRQRCGRNAVCSAKAPVRKCPRGEANRLNELSSKSCASETALIARKPSPCICASRPSVAASISTIAAP